MARKKEPTKPLFQIRGEFHDSLEHAVHKLIVLMQMVDNAISMDLVKEPAKSMLLEALTEMRAAVMEN